MLVLGLVVLLPDGVLVAGLVVLLLYLGVVVAGALLEYGSPVTLVLGLLVVVLGVLVAPVLLLAGVLLSYPEGVLRVPVLLLFPVVLGVLTSPVLPPGTLLMGVLPRPSVLFAPLATRVSYLSLKEVLGFVPLPLAPALTPLP